MENIITQEQRLGECILILCGRNPVAAGEIMKALELAGLSNGAKIIESRLPDWQPKLFYDYR